MGHIKLKMGQNRDISNQNETKSGHIKSQWDKIGTYQIKIGQNWDISNKKWDKIETYQIKMGQNCYISK